MSAEAIEEIKKIVAEKILELVRSSWSYAQIAKRTGLSKSTILRLSGVNHNPRASSVLTFSNVFSLFRFQPNSTRELMRILKNNINIKLRGTGRTLTRMRLESQSREQFDDSLCTPGITYALRIINSNEGHSLTLATISGVIAVLERETEQEVTLEDLGFQKLKEEQQV